MPAWNAAATIEVALRSVLRQSLSDWECVVVDDGSGDATAEITAARARHDARIRLLHREHGGLVAALNAGTEVCRGAIIARMDADDLMHRRRLEEQVAALDADPSLVAVGAHVRLFPRSALQEGYRAYEAWLNEIVTPDDVRREAFVECPVAHPALAIRRDVLQAFPYTDRCWPEDYDLVLRLLESGLPIGVVPRRLLSWRVTPTRFSLSDPRYQPAAFTACKAYYLSRGFLAASDRYVLWGYGNTGRALARALRDHGKHPSHVVELHPGRLGNRIAGAPVISPEALPLEDPTLRIVVSVAGVAARREIRAFLTPRGYRELEHFVCAA